MSQLHSQTKKVTAYGRKKTRIISLYSDWVPDNDGVTPSDQQATPVKARPKSTTTAPPKRAPLQTKVSQNDCRMPFVAETPARGGKAEGKKVLTVEIPLKSASKGTSRTRKVREASKTMARGVREETPVTATSTAGLRGEGMQKQQHSVMTAQVREAQTTIKQLEAKVLHLSVVDPMDQLLAACSQSAAIAFTELFTDAARVPQILKEATSLDSSPPPPPTIRGIRGRVIRPQSIGDLHIRKIGEASFSEVYGVSSKNTPELVMKVIPLLNAERAPREDGVDEPDASEPGDVVKEVEITKAMGDAGEGFVKYHGCFIVAGAYPEVLLDCWDDFKWAKSTSGYRPSNLPEQQSYAVLVLSNEGVDLESFKFDVAVGWSQALAVFKQTAQALAKAETELQFEHRDLHAGQIMISFEPASGSVKATMIDFGLSRITVPGRPTIWSAPPSDVYDGVGAQWDVNRAIREQVVDDWEGFHPVTNALWLQHILDVMLHSTKSLRKPRTPVASQAASGGHSSPIRTRRVGSAPVKRTPASPASGEHSAWQQLVALEAALATGRLKSAQEVGQYEL